MVSAFLGILLFKICIKLMLTEHFLVTDKLYALSYLILQIKKNEKSVYVLVWKQSFRRFFLVALSEKVRQRCSGKRRNQWVNSVSVGERSSVTLLLWPIPRDLNSHNWLVITIGRIYNSLKVDQRVEILEIYFIYNQ